MDTYEDFLRVWIFILENCVRNIYFSDVMIQETESHMCFG